MLDMRPTLPRHRGQRLGAVREAARLQGELVRRNAHRGRPLLPQYPPLQCVRDSGRQARPRRAHLPLQQLWTRGRPRRKCCSVLGSVPSGAEPRSVASRRREARGDAKRLWRGQLWRIAVVGGARNYPRRSRKGLRPTPEKGGVGRNCQHALVTLLPKPTLRFRDGPRNSWKFGSCPWLLRWRHAR